VIVRRLGAGDEQVLAQLALDDAHFDLEERGGALRPLPADAAAAYLADPSVLHWIAEADDVVLGHLLAYVERRRSGDALQVLLYEIGVRAERRREGVGRALIGALEAWMRDAGAVEAWVLADNRGAEAFYAACGFERDAEQPVSFTKHL
jgi:GNAT superfamily N-acetyltransferase